MVPLLDIPIKAKKNSTNLTILLDTGSGDSYISRSALSKIKYESLTGPVDVEVNTLQGQRTLSTHIISTITTRNNEDLQLKFYVTDNMIRFHQDPESTLFADNELNSAMKRTQNSLDAIIGMDQFCYFVTKMHPMEDKQIVKLDTPYGTTYGGSRNAISQIPLDTPLKEQPHFVFATQKYTSSQVPMDTLLKAINKL